MGKIDMSKIQKTVNAVAEKKNNIQAGNNLRTVALSEIIDNEKNSLFRDLTKQEMEELKVSIQEVGLLEPLVVVREGEGYKLISGHQRKKALMELGIEKVAVNVIKLEKEDEELALIHANIKQRKLSDMELARIIRVEKELIQKKIKKGTLKHQGRAIEQVAQNLEMSKDKAKRLDRLNLLIPQLQELVEEGKITTGKAQEIGLLDIATQEALYFTLEENIERFSLEEIKKIKQQDKTEREELLQKLESLQKEYDKQEERAQLHEKEKIELIKQIKNLKGINKDQESLIELYVKEKNIILTTEEKEVIDWLKELSIRKQQAVVSLMEKL